MSDKFVCIGCGKEFDKESSMYGHQASCKKYRELKNKELQEKESTYKYVCRYCGRKFSKESSLAVHEYYCPEYKKRKEVARKHRSNYDAYEYSDDYDTRGYTCECGRHFTISEFRDYMVHRKTCDVHRAVVIMKNYAITDLIMDLLGMIEVPQ